MTTPNTPAAMSEAAEFFKAHAIWLHENWSMSPEGRKYGEAFSGHVAALAVSSPVAALSSAPAPDVSADAIRSERRAITFGDIVAKHTIAMGAAVIEGHLTSPEAGMQWIVNTLVGPGHLPDVDEAIELGGAQAWFDAKMAEHEAFRAAHPMPEIPKVAAMQKGPAAP
jgi:hypothetical protein